MLFVKYQYFIHNITFCYDIIILVIKMNINLEYYKIFYIIAKNKNITKAAEELNISQPAISRMLKTMEIQMNTRLFIRKSKGVSLTKEGNELYKLIKNEINNIIKAENSFSKIINNKDIKIAINPIFLNYFINTKKLDNLLKTNDKVTFISTDDFELLNNQLINNIIDFAIIIEPDNYQFDNEINFKKIEELHPILVTKKSNIINQPLVLPEDNSKFGKLIKNSIKNTNINNNKIIKVDHYDNMLPLIENGYANGFIIKELNLDKLNENTIYEIPTSFKIPCINIGILYNTNNAFKIEKIFQDFKK